MAIGEHDDAELVRRARSGDKDAFALLVTRHRPTVLALTRRVLADPIGATDATSEATLAALDEPGAAPVPRSFRRLVRGHRA